MPPPRRSLPAGVAGRPFAVSDALQHGASRKQLRHTSLVRTAYGARALLPPATLTEAAQSLAVILPTPWAWSHETAAELLGLPLRRRWCPGAPLSVMRPNASGPVRRPQVQGRLGLERRATVPIAGMPVISPWTTWRDLAARLPRDELVILGDALAAWPLTTEEHHLGLTALVRLEAETLNRRHAPGARAARVALDLVREGSRSPMETRARLLFIDTGLPEPELNGHVVDDGGEWVATVDFVWRVARVVVEYQGDQHRTDRRQWMRDVGRFELLTDLGWRVILMTAADLASYSARAAFLDRLGRALGLGVPRRHASWPPQVACLFSSI